MINQIIRRPDCAKGGITAEEQEKMVTLVKLWTARAFRTEPIEPNKIIPAIKGLYSAAGLKEPRIVIVPSPLVMAIATGFSCAIWHMKTAATIAATDAATIAATDAATIDATDAATYAATYAATRAATYDATYDATDAATRDATIDATDDATYAATRAATYDATYAATRAATHDATIAATIDATHDATIAATDAATYAATRAATYDATDAATIAATDAATYDATRAATYAATYDATYAATETDWKWVYKLASKYARNNQALKKLMISCLTHWKSLYQGGNMAASWEAYLTAYRDILGLQLPIHEKYKSWEEAAINGGFRTMHPEFCIVSDFPRILKVDENNRPHCADGPSHQWRDGWSLYHWHGIRIPEEKRWMILCPEQISAPKIDAEENQELKRVMIERYGLANYLADSNAEELHTDKWGVLYKKQLADNVTALFVVVNNSTPEPDGSIKKYVLSVHPKLCPMIEEVDGTIKYGEPQKLTAHNAVASTFGLTGEEYAPICET